MFDNWGQSQGKHFRRRIYCCFCDALMISSYYRPQRSCGQGNIFTPVCHSFCSPGGVCLSACWDTTPRSRHPPEQTPPWDQTPQSRHPQEQTPPVQTPPWDQTPPGADNPLGPDPPWDQSPPGKQTPANSLRAAGTHPTGMHSCF